MGFPRILLLIICLFLSNSAVFPQIVFNNFPDYKINLSDTSFFDVNSRRYIIPLDGEWTVFPEKEKEKKRTVIVPSVFSGEAKLVFEKTFTITERQLTHYKPEVHFLGLNYTADISVNNNIIHRHSGGDFSFRFMLPKDLLFHDKPNKISVRLVYHLDSESTIPVKQRFMFPKNYGGIIKDVYIKLLPNISISDVDISYTISPKKNSADFSIISRIENKEFNISRDTLKQETVLTYRVSMNEPDGSRSTKLIDIKFDLPANDEKEITQNASVFSPSYWNPENPRYYTINLELWKGQELLDVTRKRVAVYALSTEGDSLTLNNEKFKLNGVTYLPSYMNFGSLYSYQQMANDIRIIKEAGFNAVRFAKTVPHPYLLYQCEKNGLLAFVEMPVNSIPPGLSDDVNFINRSRVFLDNMLRSFKDYSIIAAFGVGSSFLPELEGHLTYINGLNGFLKSKNKKTYASFAGIRISEIPGLDFYGIELFNVSPSELTEEISVLGQNLGPARVFISSATYVVSAGNTNGYMNPNSFEAQAKYFEDLIEYSKASKISGYFINSMFDFRGDYCSLISGYSDENLYKIGVLGENRSTDRLAYKIIHAKLHNAEVPTIPIGSKKDSAPMIFILFGLAIALLVGILINSGRKFREDASRALLRPYNFYADIRDQRIMSGVHTLVLAVIISTVSALLLSNLFFYFRQSIRFEKVLLSFGSSPIMDTASYLAWNPGYALVWLTLASLAALILIAIIVKTASFFVRTRVYFSGIFYVVIWSFLPLILLLPIGIILFRILDTEYTNLYMFIGLVIFTLWILYRLMKGIYVIFDVNPGGVYFYSLVVILIALGAIITYYEITSSVISYLALTFKQYKLFG